MSAVLAEHPKESDPLLTQTREFLDRVIAKGLYSNMITLKVALEYFKYVNRSCFVCLVGVCLRRRLVWCMLLTCWLGFVECV